MPHSAGGTLKPLVALGVDPGACWRWLGKVDSLGTPIKQFDGRPIPARRWLWSQLFGPIPDGLVVTTMTTCGDKGCVNPHHLRATTQAEANRAGVGAVLMPADVAEIRKAYKDRGPNTARVLADRLGCSVVTVRDVWHRRTWKPKTRGSDAA